jgi:hypothetical protein
VEAFVDINSVKLFTVFACPWEKRKYGSGHKTHLLGLTHLPNVNLFSVRVHAVDSA